MIGADARLLDDAVHDGFQIRPANLEIDRALGELVGLGEVGDGVIEALRVGRQLLDELRLVLRLALVLEELRDAVDARDRLLRVHRQLVDER